MGERDRGRRRERQRERRRRERERKRERERAAKKKNLTVGNPSAPSSNFSLLACIYVEVEDKFKRTFVQKLGF